MSNFFTTFLLHQLCKQKQTEVATNLKIAMNAPMMQYSFHQKDSDIFDVKQLCH